MHDGMICLPISLLSCCQLNEGTTRVSAQVVPMVYPCTTYSFQVDSLVSSGECRDADLLCVLNHTVDES